MNDAIQTMLVLGCVLLSAILTMQAARLVIEAIRLHRAENCDEIKEQNRRLRFENGDLLDRMAGMDAERRVHNATVGAMKDKIVSLEKENEELKAGIPVCTGYRFVKN